MALLSEERIAEAERFLDETELRSDQSKTPLLDSSINSYAFSSIMLISSYLRLNDHVNAERVAKDRVDWAEQQYGRGSIQVASFLRLVADIGRQQGKYKEIEPLYVRSLSIHRSLGRAGCLLAM